jgi:hypothetical protein
LKGGKLPNRHIDLDITDNDGKSLIGSSYFGLPHCYSKPMSKLRLTPPCHSQFSLLQTPSYTNSSVRGAKICKRHGLKSQQILRANISRDFRPRGKFQMPQQMDSSRPETCECANNAKDGFSPGSFHCHGYCQWKPKYRDDPTLTAEDTVFETDVVHSREPYVPPFKANVHCYDFVMPSGSRDKLLSAIFEARMFPSIRFLFKTTGISRSFANNSNSYWYSSRIL